MVPDTLGTLETSAPGPMVTPSLTSVTASNPVRVPVTATVTDLPKSATVGIKLELVAPTMATPPRIH